MVVTEVVMSLVVVLHRMRLGLLVEVMLLVRVVDLQVLLLDLLL